jgi:16S rRNA (adenine1518-N6/adenine1519-N6)-dimethyltransferase
MTSPRIILSRSNIRAKKKLGQHFLSDLNLIEKIVSSAGIAPDDIVLEIGPGLGALTFSLAKAAARVCAVDKDSQILEELKFELKNSGVENVVLMEHDILSFDIFALARAEKSKLRVVGNLPYNISSQILVKLIDARDIISGAVLMFQKEMAGRIMAMPGTKEYGRLSVMLRYCADVEKVADARAELFFPKPKIDSTILKIDFKTPERPANDEVFFQNVIKAAFSKRRKTLKNALLGSHLDIGAEKIIGAFARSGIDPIRRAETLSVDEFVTLANDLENEANGAFA